MAGDDKEPDETQSQDLTALLNGMRQGDADAAEKASKLIYNELHRIAAYWMRGERRGHTLQTTDLVHEAYLRLVRPGGREIEDRGHFYRLASRTMRSLLVDYHRRRQVRGGNKVPIENVQVAADGVSVNVLLVDEALEELEGMDPQAAKLVEMQFFGGCSYEESAQALGVSVSTVRRKWKSSKAWLTQRLDLLTKREASE